MAHPRPSAWALIGVLVVGLLLSPASALVVSAAPPDRSKCQPEFKDYIWGNDQKPPPWIFVLRNSGPEGVKGHVTQVDFWDYVGVVLSTEYSGTGPRGPIWQRLGALTVKQYGWYYVNQWRGGKVAFEGTDPDTGEPTTTYECYHVKDTTADQLYKPIKWDSRLGPQTDPTAWVLWREHQPSVNNLVGMRETWHISMRKWKATKNKSFMFLSGYRSGSRVPCGTDATGFRIYQASLRDCTTDFKNLTFEETVRRYFEPVYLVNTRDHDIVDGDSFWGDLGVLTPGNSGATSVRLYSAGSDNRFASAATRSLAIDFGLMPIQSSGTGNVHTPLSATDTRAMLSDLFVLAGNKLWLAKAIGGPDGYSSPTSTDVNSATGLVVDDFDGDMLADAGLITPTGLKVMRSRGDGTFMDSFNDAPAWLTGEFATRTFVGAGDFNGDGKADLVVRNTDGSYETALSRASCTYFGARGACPTDATGAPGLRDLAPAGQEAWAAANVKHVVADFDRDGRDDLVAIVKDGSDSKVWAMRSVGDGTFAAPQLMGTFAISFDNTTPVAMDINPDGMTDLAFIGANSITWLRTNERSASPASMTLMPVTNLNQGLGANFKPY